MNRIIHRIAIVALAAGFLTQCSTDQEAVFEAEQATASTKSIATSSSLGAQIAALPAFAAYVNQRKIAQDKFKVVLDAQPSSAARDAYVANLQVLLASNNSGDHLQFLLDVGFADQVDYDTWMANSISKLNDLYNDPFFDGLSHEQRQTGIADGLNTHADGFSDPPNYPQSEDLADCLNLAWKVFGVRVDLCYLNDLSVLNVDYGALNDCLDDAWIELVDKIAYCKSIHG